MSCHGFTNVNGGVFHSFLLMSYFLAMAWASHGFSGASRLESQQTPQLNVNDFRSSMSMTFTAQCQ